MTIISPSLLSANFLNLEDDIRILNKSSNLWLHLDIMDGHFVPNLTFGEPVLKKLSSITNHKLDAHFMVTNPEEYIDSFSKMNLHNFTFHWEATKHHDRLISELKKVYPSVGISLNPSTDIGLIPKYIFEKIDLILIMSVNPGFGGQSFIPSSIEKVKALKQIKEINKLSFEIQVDGGVSDKNANELREAGATNLVAGSFIFSETNRDFDKQINLLR